MNTTNATQKLHGLGQSLWLDNITRNLLEGGLLRRYIDELSVTGLTSNPTIFDQAIKNSTDYDVAIGEKLGQGKSGEQLFFELALEDLTRAADLFRPIYDRTLQFGHFETVKPGEILDFSLGKTFLFFCWPRSFVRCSDVQKWSHYMFRAVR